MTAFLRWALSPVTSIMAVRVMHKDPDKPSFDVAWRRARVRHHPDELHYRVFGHDAPTGQPIRPTEDKTNLQAEDPRP